MTNPSLTEAETLLPCPFCGEAEPTASEPGRPHIVDGEFQSDKYPTCPRGKVPLSTKDPTAQPFLWGYAQVRRAVDAQFGDDLEWALRKHGYTPGLDAEGQRVEGGDEDERKWLVWYHDPDMPPELIVRGGNAEECARKRHADQLNAWSCHLFREVFPGEQVASGAELTRLKSAQSEHDRTVRLEALEEAAKVCEATSWMRDIEWWLHATKKEVSEVSALECAKAIRSLIDQTGGEGGI